MSNGQQVQSSIGRAAQSHGHCDGIFEGFASQNVRRLEPHFQHPDNSSASFHNIILLILRFRWVRRRTWQAHPQDFNSCRHSISRVHTATATRARAGITLDTAYFLSSQIAMVPLPDTFKYRNQVNVFPVKIPRCNGSSISENSWNIHVSDGNHGARHILITAPDSDEGIHIMSAHGSFDRVCDDVT